MVKSRGPAFSAAVLHSPPNSPMEIWLQYLPTRSSTIPSQPFERACAHHRLVHEVAEDHQAQTHENRVRKSDIAHDARLTLPPGRIREQPRHQIGGVQVAIEGVY